MTTLYLLGGNGSDAHWWQDAMPFFNRYKPQPLELPGFGGNPDPACSELHELVDAVLQLTKPGQQILACGINALPVLHAAIKKPGHFKKIHLLAPVGAFLWRRRLPAVMAWWPVRKTAHILLSHYPSLFQRQFSNKRWNKDQYRRMGIGYKRCRAFQIYFKLVHAYSALSLFEWIETPVHLMWGTQDRISRVEYAPAWEALLARAPLQVSINDWGHYPYIDQPEQFVPYLEQPDAEFNGHSKAGRLRLARLVGLPVPEFQVHRLPPVAMAPDRRLWAVRSSHRSEDQKDVSNAGLSQTYLSVASEHVHERTKSLLRQGVDEVVVQRYIKPSYSGVAFVRHISMDIEWVDGHAADMLDGKRPGNFVTLSLYGTPWAKGRPSLPFPLRSLKNLLLQTLKFFHYIPLDIEWAYDGQQFYLLQVRPVTVYGWRRFLTSANIEELLQPRPSRAAEFMQRRAAGSIAQIYALWDKRVLEDNEPFTALYGDASYINGDLFLARLKQWGLSSHLLDKQIGGQSPEFSVNSWRFIASVPILLRMVWRSRSYVHNIESGLNRFQNELMQLKTTTCDTDQMLSWLMRFYLFVVQSNLVINAAYSSAVGDFAYRLHTNYGQDNDSLHRVPFESDVASPRKPGDIPSIAPMPRLAGIQHFLALRGMPGFRNYYLSVREWFRDNLTKVLYQAHFFINDNSRWREEWFSPWPAARTLQGGFWQNEGKANRQTKSLLIYPGCVEGEVGKEILVTDNIEPGHFRYYGTFKAVIVRSGGMLSHGATLLREMSIPSAIIPNAAHFVPGQKIRFNNGAIETVEENPDNR